MEEVDGRELLELLLGEVFDPIQSRGPLEEGDHKGGL